jgi:hypothetical protein
MGTVLVLVERTSPYETDTYVPLSAVANRMGSLAGMLKGIENDPVAAGLGT